MAKLNTVLFLAFLLTAYVGVLSGIASLRSASLWHYWAAVFGALAPWILATLVVTLASTLVPRSLQQAAGMAGLFPMLGAMAVALVSPVLSLFVRSDLAWAPRMKWFAIVSGVPAFIVTVFILAIFVNDSRKM